MKKIHNRFELIKIASQSLLLLMLLSSCNFKEVLTDANGQKKSFILFNPNFLLTNYQVRILDTTNAFINQEMVVTLLSNKKIVDIEGHYKNEFTVTNGILNFAVDPNEPITASNPIKLSIFIRSNTTNSIESKLIKFIGKNNFDRVFIATLNQSIPVSVASSMNSNAGVANAKRSSSTDELSRELLKIGGYEVPIYIKKNVAVKSLSPFSDEQSWRTDNVRYDENLNVTILTRPDNLRDQAISKELILEYGYKNALDLNTMDNRVTAMGKDINDNFFQYTVEQNGSTNYLSLVEASYTLVETTTSPKPNWNREIALRTGTKIYGVFLGGVRTNTELKDCPAGFNLTFTNIAKGTTPELGYITYRNDSISGRYYITDIGMAKVNEQNPTYNTGELYFSNKKNKIVLQENSQYDFTPSTVELIGTSACGSNTNIRIVPKQNVTMYKLAVKTQCENDNFSIVANANVLFRKKGRTSWEGLTIKNGVGTIYLENNSVYEVTGNYGKNQFDFNFTNDPSLFETQKTESLNKNKDLRNLTYSVSKDQAANKLLSIELLYNQSACPF